MVGLFIRGRRCIRMKSFITGAIPLGTFLYLGVFHTGIFVVLFMAAGLGFASYLLGISIREEFGDLRDKEEY